MDAMALPVEGKHRWTLATVFSIVFLDQLGIGIVIPILTPLLFDPSAHLFSGPFDLASRSRIIGFLIAAYPLAQFFGAPLLGALSDRYGRKIVLLLSLAGTAVGYVVFGWGIFAGNLTALFLSRFLAGFTGGNIATANSAIADISTKLDKVRNFGIVNAAYGLGFILGPYTGGKLSDSSVLPWFTYSTPFWVAAGVTVANILLVAFAFRETIREKLPSRMDPLTGFRNVAKAFRMPNARAMFLVIFLLWSGFNAFTQFFQIYLVEYFAVTPSALGRIFAYVGFWLALTLALINRWIAQRFDARHVLAVTLPIVSVAVFLHLLPRELWMYYTILPLVAVAMGLSLPNITAVVSGLADERSQGEIIGIQHSMQALALVIPPIISGFVVAWHVSLPVLGAAVMVFISWLVYLLWFTRAPEEVFHEV
jgi:MFS transporter, DHA1 family, tetracycline resistance protein